MDTDIWIASKRGFPFNINLLNIVVTSLFTPIAIAQFTFPFLNVPQLSKLMYITIVMSLLAFFVTNSLIGQFKDTLANKGLFGKDLNKAGNRDDKPKV